MVVTSEHRSYLIKVNRISAWALLIFMVIFLVSGYALVDHIIMPVQQARYLHTQLDMYLVFFFLVHVLINTKFTLRRWRIGDGQIVNTLLVAVGVISLWMVYNVSVSH
jgi:hypothetical protein